jgi:hypothetical protein
LQFVLVLLVAVALLLPLPVGAEYFHLNFVMSRSEPNRAILWRVLHVGAEGLLVYLFIALPCSMILFSLGTKLWGWGSTNRKFGRRW